MVIQTTVALDGVGADIARARHLAAGFLTRVQAEHGVPVSQRALDLTQLVVSELVTNARKYAPSPVLLDLRIVGDLVEMVVFLVIMQDAGAVPTQVLEEVVDPQRVIQALEEHLRAPEYLGDTHPTVDNEQSGPA
jgi:anti-sigma regulatory factor (Ser/Thr protein kinase)